MVLNLKLIHKNPIQIIIIKYSTTRIPSNASKNFKIGKAIILKKQDFMKNFHKRGGGGHHFMKVFS